MFFYVFRTNFQTFSNDLSFSLLRVSFILMLERFLLRAKNMAIHTSTFHARTKCHLCAISHHHRADISLIIIYLNVAFGSVLISFHLAMNALTNNEVVSMTGYVLPVQGEPRFLENPIDYRFKPKPSNYALVSVVKSTLTFPK